MLDKNFHFLLTKEIVNKNALIEKLEKACSCIKRFEYDQSISDMRSILESFMHTIETKYEGISIGANSLHQKIEKLINTYSIDSNIVYCLNQIRKIGNISIHEIGIQHNDIDAIYTLYCLHKIFKWFFNIEIAFDRMIYNPKDDEISIINKESFSEEQQFNNDVYIQKHSLEEWLKNKNKIIVPIYQRKYVWTEDNIETLFNDIKQRMNDKKVHFFGTIAGKNIVINNEKHIKIIDGQQRLTTTIILLCAIRDILFEINPLLKETFMPEIINNLTNYIKNAIGTNKGNLSFECIVSNQHKNAFDPKEQVSINYNFIYTKLKSEFKTVKEYIDFINTYLKQFQVSTISFNEEKLTNKDEMIIFENINSKGKSLTFVDIIKNYVLNLCNEKIICDNEKDIIIEYNRVINHSDNKHVQNFYMSFINYYFGKEPKKDDISNFKDFKIAIDQLFNLNSKDFSTINEYCNFMSLIEEYYNIYLCITNSKNKSIHINNLPDYNKVNEILNTLEDKKSSLLLTLCYFLNDYAKKYEIKDKHLVEDIFFMFIKFIIKTTIASIQGNSDIKRYIILTISEIRNKVFGTGELTTLKEIYKYFQEKMEDNPPSWWKYSVFKHKLYDQIQSHKMIVPLLALTEMHMCANSNELIKRTFKLSLEHIMPISLNDEWLITLKHIDNLNEIHEKHVNLLGNYLLLDLKSNSSIKNKLFYKKQDSCYKGIKSPLYKNENLDIDVSRKNNWSFHDITNRTNALADYILGNVIKK